MNFNGQTSLVIGGSRGFGRGIVKTLVAKDMHVVVAARGAEGLKQLAQDFPSVRVITADATDEQTVSRLLDEVKPNLLVSTAGSSLDLKPLQEHTWETFSRPWQEDVKSTFLLAREVLRNTKHAPSHVIFFGSAAALRGSWLTGGYSGAKQMNAFIADYAADEAVRLKLQTRFHCLIPGLSPHTKFGAAAADAYASRAGVSVEEYMKRLPSQPPTPEIIGSVVSDLYTNPIKWEQVMYRVTGDGLVAIEQ
jgi:NAD(P)-dependent dehydrogenase (short-subunit alcohol dehydrogenase family)